jgi:hypothetical protein
MITNNYGDYMINELIAYLGVDPIKLGAMIAFVFNAWFWSKWDK